jgi:CRISPR-associated protein Cas2
MMVLVTYDVRTAETGGAKRLRRVAKGCRDFGQRDIRYSRSRLIRRNGPA